MISIKRETRNFEKLFKKIEELARSKIEAGYFPEQGEHPEAEMSYVDLASIHASGDGNFPARDVRIPTGLYFESGVFKTQYNKLLNDYFYRGVTLPDTLNRFGEDISKVATSFFGVPSQYIPMNSSKWASIKGGNTPLVFEGYLLDAWSYKNSVENVVVTYRGS